MCTITQLRYICLVFPFNGESIATDVKSHFFNRITSNFS